MCEYSSVTKNIGEYSYEINETRWVETGTKEGRKWCYLGAFYASIKIITLIDYIWYFQHLQVLCLSDKLYPYSYWIQSRDLTVGTFFIASFSSLWKSSWSSIKNNVFSFCCCSFERILNICIQICVRTQRMCVNRLTFNLYDVGLCHCAHFNVLVRWQVKNTFWQDSWYSKWK